MARAQPGTAVPRRSAAVLAVQELPNIRGSRLKMLEVIHHQQEVLLAQMLNQPRHRRPSAAIRESKLAGDGWNDKLDFANWGQRDKCNSVREAAHHAPGDLDA
jgi:hypothetical protein